MPGLQRRRRLLGLFLMASSSASAGPITYRIRAENARAKPALSVEVLEAGRAARRYEVGPSSASVRMFPPVVHRDYFHVTGESLFPDAPEDGAAKREVTIVWEIPESWTLVNSFGAAERRQSFVASHDEYRHALYVGGRFRAVRRDVDGRPVWTALRGKWLFSDDDFADLAARIFAAERGFWNDHDFPHYLISLRPMKGVRDGHHGSAYNSAFGIEAGPRTPLAGLAGILAHELFHAWNGGKIGKEEPAELMYWFSEGFTNYYGRLLLLRAGITTFAEHVADYNEVLRHYHASPVRGAPNERIRADFWNDRHVELLPYQRGDVLAHNWNARIRRRKTGKSLDDFMRAMLELGRRGVLASPRSIDGALRPFLPEGADADLALIEKGSLLEPEPDSLGPCARLVMRETPVYELGFDFKASAKPKRVIGLVVGGSAAAGGVRAGDARAGWSLQQDPDQEVEVSIVRGRGRKTIRWLPQKRWEPGKAPAPVPQFELVGDPARAACRL